MSNFSERIRKLRMAKNLTAVDIERALGLSGGSWSRYERSLTMPGLSVAVRIADYFGLSLDDLVGRNTDIPHLNVVRLRHAEERLGQKEFEKAWPVVKKVWDLVSLGEDSTRKEDMKVIDVIADLLHERRTNRSQKYVDVSLLPEGS